MRDVVCRGVGRWAGRGDRGDTLAFLVIWPTLLVAILVLLVHALIVSNARAEAEVAASAGLRAAWRAAADADFLHEPGSPLPYRGEVPHPAVREMAGGVRDAVARVAAEEDGWRWWTPGTAEVRSDWCAADPAVRPSDPTDPGWVRVVVSGDVSGPVAGPSRPGLCGGDGTGGDRCGPAAVGALGLLERARLPATLLGGSFDADADGAPARRRRRARR